MAGSTKTKPKPARHHSRAAAQQTIKPSRTTSMAIPGPKVEVSALLRRPWVHR